MMRQSTFKPVHKHSEYEMAVKKIDAARKQSAAAKEPPPAAKREVKFARKSVVGANARPESIHRKTTASAPLAAATITEEAASATPPPPPTLDSRPTIEAVLELDVDKRRSEVARQLEDAFSAAVSDAMFALPADPVAFVLAHASLASFVQPPSPSKVGAAAMAASDSSVEAGRARVLGVLEPLLSAAVGNVLHELPAEPTAVVLQRLHAAQRASLR